MVLPNVQAAKAAAQGGVTSFADNAPQEDGIQNASLALIRKLLGNRGATGGRVSEGTRVPEEATEGLLPTNPETGRPTTYKSTKERLQAENLSLAGKERLEAAGGDTGVAINLPVDPADRPVPRLDLEGDVTTTARQAIAEKPTGLADEGDAEDLLKMQEPEMLVDTANGIDFNFANMDSGEDVNRTINAMSEIIKDPTEAAKRGIQTNQETLAKAGDLLADEVGLSKRLLRKKTGELLNAEEMTAVRILLQKSADRLTNLAKEIRDGDNGADKLIEFRRQMAIHAGIQMKAKGAQTEIARALQAFKIPTSADTPVEALQSVVDEYGGTQTNMNIAKAYLKILDENGQAAANKFAFGTLYARTRDAWLEVYINGMLSYLPTHLKNALGTPLFMVYNLMADLTGAGLGGGMRLTGLSSNPDGMYAEDVFARVNGYLHAFRDAFIVAGRTFSTEDPASVMNKIEAGNLRAIDSETLGISGTAGTAVDALGRLIRIPGRALMAADDFWRVIASRGELYEQAVRQIRFSKAAGKADVDALDDGLMVLLDPQYKAGELDAASRYATLTDDMGEQLTAGTKFIRTFFGRFMGNILMPFAKAPTNAMRRVGENHPLIVAASMLNSKSTIRQNLLGENGARAQQRAMGRLALGTGTMSMLYMQAIDGNITGAYPTDKQSQKMLPKGWQPYSIVYIGSPENRAELGLEPWGVDEDGDPLPKYNKQTGLPNGELIYVSYQGLEPVSALLGISASTAQNQTMFYDPEDRLNLFTASVVATGHYFRDLAMLQTLGNVVRSMEYNDISVLTDSPVSGTIAVFPQPFSSVVRNIDKLVQTEKRTVEKPIEYYTLQDVQQLYESAKDSANPYKSVPYALIGTPKDITNVTQSLRFFRDTVVNGWNTQLMNIPYVNERIDKFAYKYDVLGRRKERSVEFGVTPIQALWNNLTPFKVSTSEKLKPFQIELIRLGMPLSETRKTMEGIKLSNLLQSDLNEIAKNKIMLPVQAGRPPYKFVDHIQALMGTGAYLRATDQQKITMIQQAENKFYMAAFPAVLAKPQHKQLAQAYYQRKLVRDMMQ